MTSKLNKPDDVWQVALYILGRRSHSEYELRQKLYHKAYTSDQIDDVITRLLTYHYLNDEALATALFTKLVQAGKYSLPMIISKLKQRGLPDHMIKNVTTHYHLEDEWKSALKIVNQRFKSLNEISTEKIYRFLASRGFSSTSINKIIKQLGHDEIE